MDLKGDEIVSKGNDGVFIPNEPIGTIESIFVEDGSDYISAIIKLHVDYKSVSHVYVVKNLFKGERKALEEKLDD